MAHELAHVVQLGGRGGIVRRQALPTPSEAETGATGAEGPTDLADTETGTPPKIGPDARRDIERVADLPAKLTGDGTVALGVKDRVFAFTPLQTRRPDFNHDLSALEICSMAKNCNPSVQLMGGLTRVHLPTMRRVTLESSAVRHPDPSKLKFFFKPLRMDISFDWVRIWIAREFKRGSCAYRAITDHEMEHVAQAHYVLRWYAHRIEAALNQAGIPTEGAPLEIANSPSAFQAENAKYTALIEKILLDEYTGRLQRIYDRIDSFFQTIDTPEEYAKVRMSCPASSWPF